MKKKKYKNQNTFITYRFCSIIDCTREASKILQTNGWTSHKYPHKCDLTFVLAFRYFLKFLVKNFNSINNGLNLKIDRKNKNFSHKSIVYFLFSMRIFNKKLKKFLQMKRFGRNHFLASPQRVSLAFFRYNVFVSMYFPNLTSLIISSISCSVEDRSPDHASQTVSHSTVWLSL
jgi:hypothetical protein